MNFRLLLLPFSLLYGFITLVRNKLFDLGIKKEKQFEIPVISVGNITVGGTGKTPHIEFLIETLKHTEEIAVLSRGYKRKTKGFVLADKRATPESVGDEPYQIFRKNPSTMVTVCEKRVQGIEKILGLKKNIDVILLDDAYQHRHVKPGMSILLVDYNRPIFNDLMLPAGNLREGRKGIKRADIVIVTKVPNGNITIEEKREWNQKLKLTKKQLLYFSTFQYASPQPLFSKSGRLSSLIELADNNVKVLLVTGIAEPAPFIDYLESCGLFLEIIRFPDHHNFNNSDLVTIKAKFDAIKKRRKIILTTEKDAVRLKHLKNYPRNLKEKTYYIPVQVQVLEERQKEFESKIIDYVRKD